MSDKYAALASTTEIKDITNDELNGVILHKLKNNDESFHKLMLIADG